MFLLLLIRKLFFIMITRGIFWQCLVYGHKLDRIVGMMLCHLDFGARDGCGESSFFELFIKAPLGRFFLKKFFKGGSR
jgi:hypothetical protein